MTPDTILLPDVEALLDELFEDDFDTWDSATTKIEAFARGEQDGAVARGSGWLLTTDRAYVHVDLIGGVLYVTSVESRYALRLDRSPLLGSPTPLDPDDDK